MRIDHDVHVHTALSACCNDRQAIPDKIIARAARAGLRTLGFTDHLWDRAIPGASDWYAPQDAEHVLAIRRQIPAGDCGVRVLVGCEAEYCGRGKVSIAPATAGRFDFVLIAASHFHMKGLVVPQGELAADRVAELLLERFHEAVGLDLGVPTGIAHPLVPFGYFERLDETVGRLGDGELSAAFARAAERRISLEIHPAMFASLSRQGETGLAHDATFLRVLALAKRAGCLFHFASDAHTLDGIGSVRRLERFADALGIGPEDVHPLFRA